MGLRFIYRYIQKRVLHKYIGTLTIDKINTLDGFDFEELLYYIFFSLGYKVTKTQKTRDFGADLMLTHKGKNIVIQSKMYYGHSVGNSAVQEISTAKNFYMADMGIVITNSVFTKPAKTLAEVVGVKLLDKDWLIKMINADKYEQKALIDELFVI